MFGGGGGVFQEVGGLYWVSERGGVQGLSSGLSQPGEKCC